MKFDIKYSEEPPDSKIFTRSFDRFYSNFAKLYDAAIKILPWWKTCLNQSLPYIQGPRVLEVSFGTGYLLSRYAGNFFTCGIDYNRKMVETARNNLQKHCQRAYLKQADVEHLPYKDGSFDCIVSTMAFSGFPNGMRAMAEMVRVLKKGGRLILIDVNYPQDRNALGMMTALFWQKAGDLLRDMNTLFEAFNLEYTHREIGLFGTVQLYVARK